MTTNLKNDIDPKNTILFVGAGVSATVKLPTWSELISHIAKELGYDDKLFREYGDSLVLAEYYEKKKGNLSSLTNWMKENWAPNPEKIETSEIYNSIVNLNFPLIYTTNYDHCLETAFDLKSENYHKIVSVEDIAKINSTNTQIIKFHGDYDDENSIVLTESQYFDRLNFESPLDIKLRSDMLGKSILFIGYSLSDINIRLLIYKLDQLWTNHNEKNRPKSYIFMSHPNPIQETILQKSSIQPIIGEHADKSESIKQFLLSLSNHP